jgi:hypothetical protein
MQDDAFGATERINSGAEIPTVSPSLIEHLWVTISRIPKPLSPHTGICLGDPDALPENPEQQVAMMARYALLDALVERGILSEYMEDEALRKKVIAAAASLPCNKNDLGEALAEKLLRDLPPERLEEAQKELSEAGYDPAHLKVAEKFIEWMHDS